MSTGPIRIQPIVDRLEALVPRLEFVGRAPDFETAFTEQNPATPACYVVLAMDDPSPRVGASTILIQRVTSRFAVVTSIRDYSAAQRSGRDTEDEVSEVIGAIRRALLRWRHPDADTEIELGGRGQPVRVNDGVLWWEDMFELTYQIRV